MFGHSAVVRPEDQPAPTSATQARPASMQVIHRLDEAATSDHPLKSPATPFRVRFLVGGKERKGEFRGNDLLVPLNQGEVYQIEVENRTGRPAVMRLLVDGLNTLPEKMKDKSVMTLEVAPRVNLAEARPWVLDARGGTKNIVVGFATETGDQGKLREFDVVEADKSLAARKQFTEQIGLITAAFDEPAAERLASSLNPGSGTDLGQEVTADLSEQTGVGVGNLQCVINNRYVFPEALRGGR